MSNEQFVVDNQKTIKTICNQIAKHGSLADDLAQWVSMWLLEHEVEEKYLTPGFIHSIAYKAYFLRGSEFKREHFTAEVIKVDDVISYTIPLESDNIDAKYKELLSELTEEEKLWVTEVVKRNSNISLLQQHTKISRITATERMESIYQRLRDLNK